LRRRDYDTKKKRKRKIDAQLAALAAGRNRAGPRAPIAGFTTEAHFFALEIDGNRRHSHEPNRFQADDFPLQRQRSPPARKNSNIYVYVVLTNFLKTK